MRHSVIAVLFLTMLVLGSCESEPPVFLDDDFTAWTQLNADSITATIPGHGSGVRNIFINDTGTGVTATRSAARTIWDYPEGTVIVKTVAAPGASQSPSETTILLGMVKNADHPDNQGGWIWLTRNPRTGEEMIFDSEYCVTCHVDANERRTATHLIPTGVPNPDREFRDFVFHPYYPTGE